MIEILLSIIDRLLKLKEYQGKRLRRIFEDLLEPVFKDLLLVHQDYIRMFEGVDELLPSIHELSTSANEVESERIFREKLSHAAEYLSKKRVEFEPVRVKLRAIAAALEGVCFGAEADDFIQAVLTYFPREMGRSQGGVTYFELLWPLSASSTLLMKIISLRDDPSYKLITNTFNLPAIEGTHSLSYELSMTIQSHREQWSRVCESFARLKLVVTSG